MSDRHLQLVRPDSGGPVPDYVEHGDRRVRWRPWEAGPRILCLRVETGCAKCGSHAPPWIAYGLVDPLPGELFDNGRGRLVPAWPVAQLAAFRCPACRDLTLFDRGPDGNAWVEITGDVAAPGLFPATAVPPAPPVPRPPRPRKHRRRPAQEPAPPRRRTRPARRNEVPHGYQSDHDPDFFGADRCLYCHMPRKPGDCHDIPPVPAEAALIDARILGERPEDPDRET